MPSLSSFRLANGMKIPAVGLGTFQSGGKTLLYVLRIGNRHIDTAFNYEIERYVGEAVRESGIPRN